MHRRALLLLALFAPAATSQITEKEAVAQVKAAGKGQLASLKATGKAALATLDANLDIVDGTLNEASPVATIVSQVGSMANAFTVTMHAALSDAIGLVDGATTITLQALGDPVDLEGIYPEALYSGASGVLDKARADLVASAIKTRDKGLKRLIKTATKAEKEANIALTFHLLLPAAPLDGSPNESGSTTAGIGAHIDLLVAGSDMDAGTDGIIVVGGWTGNDSDAVDCTVFGQQIDADSDAAINGRFLFVLNDTGAGLSEGNYIATVEQGTGPFISQGTIGIR